MSANVNNFAQMYRVFGNQPDYSAIAKSVRAENRFEQISQIQRGEDLSANNLFWSKVALVFLTATSYVITGASILGNIYFFPNFLALTIIGTATSAYATYETYNFFANN